VLLVFVVQHALMHAVDSTAKERATDAVRLTAADGILPSSAEADNVVQIVDASGRIVASTANVAGEARLFTFAPKGAVSLRTVKHVKVPDAADSYRVAVAVGSGGRLVYAAVPNDDQREAVRRLEVAVGVGLPVVVAVMVLLTWLLVGRALRPAEEASRRQRGFVADAAHELRSPIASLRTQLEVAAAHPDDVALAQAVPGLLANVDRLARLAEDLLQLARLDDGVPLLQHLVDFDDLVFAEATRARAVAPASVEIDVSQVSAAQVQGDAAALGRLVRNIIDNAVRYAEARVLVTLHAVDGIAELVVSDDGPGVPAADRDRIFERFTRLDDARTHGIGGAGLGLAIVRAVTAAHGGTVIVADGASGARFVVRLPASTADVGLSTRQLSR
jgi:signal transduction histidine kinase